MGFINRVGDFGTVDNDTGGFHCEGNIYDTSFMQYLRSSRYKFDIDLADTTLRPTEQDVGTDLCIIKSQGVTGKAIIEYPKSAVPDSVNVLKVDLQFDGYGPAVVSVLYKPRYSSLPNDERITRLLKSMPDILKGKLIITEAISCAGCMMRLSERKSSVQIKLLRCTHFT
ncbi:hypothetical protein EDB19DRAFT_1302726 [Suillus lakei]|nr:hypothetical protein EDB19DRAFT_1302726 [Suillus lakei]